ncbi:radical SAM protein [candidate division KSB3 bacterium]|uniref:Radical SAM protein n=1 Tax=candidate division KSB3 bacterium TaxID=2044937 RepID=A0A9D5JV85_9BACT|nr:radical SAM protein [candidate division KSB3 bacterium]MBD3324785.1 radical SAM protein [candidate division KSB3 bacterium]
MKHYTPDIIYIDDSAYPYPYTWEIVERLPHVPVRRVRDKAEALASVASAGQRIDIGKQIFFLTTQKGRFFKKCPGTKGLICCNYYVVNFATNCHLDCSYCILQGYYENNPFLTFFVNVEDLLEELDQVFSADPHRQYRVGTGEFTDSLALEELTGFSQRIVPFFATYPNATLELKTKADTIEPLLDLNHQGRTSVAWSVNTPAMIASEEPHTATLDERLDAARRCQDAGYRIGFHFDPLFFYPGWESAYHQVVERLFDAVAPGNISWISLGGFRYSPDLKPIIRRRFPDSTILCGEFVPCADGKMRYLKHLRLEMYASLLATIKRYGNQIPVYLCMESPQVWKQVYGWTPQCDRHLTHLFDRRLTA